MHYSPVSAVPSPWERAQQQSQRVTSLCGAQAFFVIALLTAQRHCMAPADHGELCRSTIPSIQVELCRARSAQVCVRRSHLCGGRHEIS